MWVLFTDVYKPIHMPLVDTNAEIHCSDLYVSKCICRLMHVCTVYGYVYANINRYILANKYSV